MEQARSRYKNLRHIQQNLGLTNEELSYLFKVEPHIVREWHMLKTIIRDDIEDILFDLMSFYEVLVEIESYEEWLITPHPGLDQKSPLQAILDNSKNLHTVKNLIIPH